MANQPKNPGSHNNLSDWECAALRAIQDAPTSGMQRRRKSRALRDRAVGTPRPKSHAKSGNAA